MSTLTKFLQRKNCYLTAKKMASAA